jgi:hypothetical protein
MSDFALLLADHVWNRAALDGGGPKPRDGDRALADLLLAHGLIMNGGLGHALEDAGRPVQICSST